MCTKHTVEPYIKALMTVAASKDQPQEHGLGGIIKEMFVTTDYVSFLSKDVFLAPFATYMSR